MSEAGFKGYVKCSVFVRVCEHANFAYAELKTTALQTNLFDGLGQRLLSLVDAS